LLRLRVTLTGVLRHGAACGGQRCRADGNPQMRSSHSKSCCHDQIILISQCLPLLLAR
jgi:hypothetical protein